MSSGRPPPAPALNPPKASQARGASSSITTRKQTANFISPAMGRTTEDMLKAPAYSSAMATDTPSAQKLLAEHSLFPPNTDPSHSLLCNILLCLTFATGINAQLADVIRAIAILVNSLSPSPSAPEANPSPSLLSALKEQIDRLASTTDEIQTASSANIASAISIATLVDNTKQDLKKASLSLAQASEAHALSHSSSPPLQKPTYASVAKHNAHDRATALCESQTRTVRITPSQEGPSSFNDLDEEVLLEKANNALDRLRSISSDIPPSAKFLSARRTKSGSILYEVDSPETAAWLRTPKGQLSFTANFGPDVSLATKPFPVLAEYVPIRTLIEDPKTLRDIEHNNNLPPDSVRSMRWIKPVERRIPNQRHAHAIIDFHCPTDANFAIKKGLRISGKKTTIRRLLSEPLRCMKCQSFEGAHFAKNCQSSRDVCGTCAGNHRTSSCSVSSPNDRYCANCKTEGHAAWERGCPTFSRLLQRHHAHLPDAPYRFYPIPEDSSSWELNNSEKDANAEPIRKNRPKPIPQPHPMFAEEDGQDSARYSHNRAPDPPSTPPHTSALTPAPYSPSAPPAPPSQNLTSTPAPPIPHTTRPSPASPNPLYDSPLTSPHDE